MKLYLHRNSTKITKLLLKIFLIASLASIHYQISLKSATNTDYYLNEVSHKLNTQMDKSSTQIKITSGIRKLEKAILKSSITTTSTALTENKESTTGARNKLKFLNDSSKFTSTEQINTVTSVGEPISGDFTVRIKVHKLPGASQGLNGVGFSTVKYDQGTLMSGNMWPGMINFSGSEKQVLITDNFSIAYNQKWNNNSNANFHSNDKLTLFRKGTSVGFRVNDLPNDFKADFSEPVYILLCGKYPGAEFEVVSLNQQPLEFGQTSDANVAPSVGKRLKEVQNAVGKLDTSDNSYQKVMEALFIAVKDNSGKSGSDRLDAGSSIHNNEILKSPNDIYSVEVRNAELVVVENSGKFNEGVLWKNGSVGGASGEKQILGLLDDATLYLQTEGMSDYYWTNKDRKSRKGFTQPFSAKIKDNGEFLIEDKNFSPIWSTHSAVVSNKNTVGTFLSQMVPLANGKCITSENRKAKLCNKDGSFVIKDAGKNLKWQSLAAKGQTSAIMLLDASCKLEIKDDSKSYWQVKPETSTGKCVLVVNDAGDILIKPQIKSEQILWSNNPLTVVGSSG